MRRNRSKNNSKKTIDTIVDFLKWFFWCLILVYALSLIIMYLWMIVQSFKLKEDWLFDKIGFPLKWSLNNYKEALENMHIIIYAEGKQKWVYLPELLKNSLVFLFGSGFCAATAPMVVGYAASRFDFKFNKVLDAIVVVTMVLPVIGSTASMITTMKTLNIYGTWFGIFFMKSIFVGTNYLIFKSAFKSVGKEMSEAAQIDGASEWQIMTRINIPMIFSLYFVILLLQWFGFWGDWQTPMIYLPKYPTVAYALYELQFSHDYILSYKPVHLAAAIMVSIPTVIFYSASRKKMNSVSYGGLKG